MSALRKLAHAIYSFSPRVVKTENCQKKCFDIFLILAQNIDSGYKLEPPRRGGSNEYPQSMFWIKNKKNRYTPAYISFNIASGVYGVFLASHVCSFVFGLLSKVTFCSRVKTESPLPAVRGLSLNGLSK